MTAEHYDQHSSARVPDERTIDMDQVWEEFEPPDGLTAQYLMREIRMQANPRVLHTLIVNDIVVQCANGSLRALGELGIDLGPDGKPRPDVAFLDPEDIDPDWRDTPAARIPAVVEVVSESSAVMDYRDKTKAYARHRIPAYLIVDPRDATWTVMELVDASEGPTYVRKAQGIFGDPIDLAVAGETKRIDTASWHPYPARHR